MHPAGSIWPGGCFSCVSFSWASRSLRQNFVSEREIATCHHMPSDLDGVTQMARGGNSEGVTQMAHNFGDRGHGALAGTPEIH